jgi:hypothetical protein
MSVGLENRVITERLLAMTAIMVFLRFLIIDADQCDQ